MRNHVIICATRPRGSEARPSLPVLFESHAICTFADDRLQTDNKTAASKPKNGDRNC